MKTSLTKLANLIEKLAKRSEADALEWAEPFTDCFETTIGETEIRVSVQYSDFDPEADPDYHVTLVAHGKIVDSVSDRDLSKYLPGGAYAVMRRLYLSARRTARGVASLADKLDEALGEDAE